MNELIEKNISVTKILTELSDAVSKSAITFKVYSSAQYQALAGLSSMGRGNLSRI